MTSCNVCLTYSTVPTPLDFHCAVCGERMRELVAPEMGVILHCPSHCTTLLPSNDMVAQAKARRN